MTCSFKSQALWRLPVLPYMFQTPPQLKHSPPGGQHLGGSKAGAAAAASSSAGHSPQNFLQSAPMLSQTIFFPLSPPPICSPMSAQFLSASAQPPLAPPADSDLKRSCTIATLVTAPASVFKVSPPSASQPRFAGEVAGSHSYSFKVTPFMKRRTATKFTSGFASAIVSRSPRFAALIAHWSVTRWTTVAFFASVRLESATVLPSTVPTLRSPIGPMLSGP